MKRIIILILCLFGWALAQTQTDHITTENPFFYDDFQEGHVFFTEGNPVKVKLNYNFLSRKMQYVDHQNNDRILDLVVKPNMTHIEIGKDIFVPFTNESWAVVIQDGPVALLERKQLTPSRKKGAYGTTLTTSGAQAVSNFGQVTETASGFETVNQLQEISFTTTSVDRGGAGGGALGTPGIRLYPMETYKVETSYWLMKNNRVFAATRKNFLRLHPEIRPQLEKYLSEHKVNFKNYEELQGLTRYSNSLLMQLAKSK